MNYLQLLLVISIFIPPFVTIAVYIIIGSFKLYKYLFLSEKNTLNDKINYSKLTEINSLNDKINYSKLSKINQLNDKIDKTHLSVTYYPNIDINSPMQYEQIQPPVYFIQSNNIISTFENC